MKSNVIEMYQNKLALEDRIRRLSADIKCPLEADFNEQATQLTNRELLMKLLEVEQENLRTLNMEIKKAMMG